VGPQAFERYITQSGYCATWSLWYIDMRLTYPDVDRETLVKGMFDKLQKMLLRGTLTDYLLDYARQVYAVMVADFPHYADYFIHYEKYRRMRKTRREKKAFDAFLDEMNSLVKDPQYINRPVHIAVEKVPNPVSVRVKKGPAIIPPGKIYKKKRPSSAKKKRASPKRKRATNQKRRRRS